jgi:hypothetical protein
MEVQWWSSSKLRTDGDFCHQHDQGRDAEITQKI